MSRDMVDREGNLVITYEVSVNCHGKRVLSLGTGMKAVFRFAEIAEAGIEGAKEVKCLWGNNYLVTMSGKELKHFIKVHYPKYSGSLNEIKPNKEYVIDCYDMS